MSSFEQIMSSPCPCGFGCYEGQGCLYSEPKPFDDPEASRPTTSNPSARIELLREMLRKAGDESNAANAIRSLIHLEKYDVRKAFTEALSSGEQGAFDLGAWHGMRFALYVFEQWAAMTSDPGPSGRFRIVENSANGLPVESMTAKSFVESEGMFRLNKEDGGSCNG